MDFFDRYHNLKARLAPFRLRTDYETVKTVAAIDALADRADVIHYGNIPGGKILDNPVGIDENNLFSRALAHLEALERGEFPLLGKFTEPGISLSDHSFFEKDGLLHLFYNRGFVGYDWPERSVELIGHAVTENLTDWKILPPAVSVTAGQQDSFSVWSPCVLEKDGQYYMFYTGVNRNIAQATCLAVSDDLIRWNKVKENPVYRPGDWAPWGEDRWSDCRDCFILKEGSRYYQYFCTTAYTDGEHTRNAVGIASSADLIHWQDECRFLPKGCAHMPESPFVIRRGARFYLFYTNCGQGTCYAVADNPLGPWEERGLLIGDPQHTGDLAHVPSCSEVFCFCGRWYISFATRLPGNEQYLELMEFFWNEDGTVSVGEKVVRPVK